jgi:DNA (cytosine-5)-methyltransferase 1
VTLTYAELFAGAGGLSMGLEAAGFHAIAHAEIEPHARAVLRHKWPETRLDGDVTKINGKDYEGCTLLSGGSPCQDLSVAGKRAGLGGARSGLFYEQVRIWNESGAPYLLWENVGGALSSNNGRDFAAVLSALVGATITVPSDGWGGGRCGSRT